MNRHDHSPKQRPARVGRAVLAVACTVAAACAGAADNRSPGAMANSTGNPTGNANAAGSQYAQSAQNTQNTRNTGTNTTATGTASGTAGSTTSGTAANQRSNPTLPVTAVLVLLPAAQGADPNLGNGCWVRFYDNQNFRGESLTLVGPVDMANMDAPGDAWQDWDSAIVGPKARVTTYDNENFNDRTATLSPGARIPDLRDRKLGWFEEVKSARVSCSG